MKTQRPSEFDNFDGTLRELIKVPQGASRENRRLRLYIFNYR